MFSHGFQMVRVRRINNGFIGLNGFWVPSRGHLSPLGFAACQSKKCTNRAINAPTEHMNAISFVEGVSKLSYSKKITKP